MHTATTLELKLANKITELFKSVEGVLTTEKLDPTPSAYELKQTVKMLTSRHDNVNSDMVLRIVESEIVHYIF